MLRLAWSHLNQGEFADLGQVTPDQSETWKTRSALPTNSPDPFLLFSLVLKLDLHLTEVSFYADFVGVATFGQMTKMAETSFNLS